MDYLKSLTGKGESIHSMDVHREMSKLLDDKNCLIFEGSDFAFYGASFYPSERSDRWFVNGVLGMIGWGVPYGFGAKVALPEPGKPMISFFFINYYVVASLGNGFSSIGR